MFRTFEDTFSEIERLYDQRDYQKVVISCGKLTEKLLFRVFSQFHTTLPQAEEKQQFLSFEEKQGEDYFQFIKNPSIGVGIRYYLALTKQFPEHQWLDPAVKIHLNCVNRWRNLETHAAGQSLTDKEIPSLPKDEDAAEVLQATEDIIRTLAMNQQAEAGEQLPLIQYFSFIALKEGFNSASNSRDYQIIIEKGMPLAATFLDLLLERLYLNLSVEEKKNYLEFFEQISHEEKHVTGLGPYKSLFDKLRFQTRVTKSKQISDILARLSGEDKNALTRRATSPLIQLLDIIYQIVVDPRQQTIFRICDQVHQMLLENSPLTEQDRIELKGIAKFQKISEAELGKIIESVEATFSGFPDLLSKVDAGESSLPAREIPISESLAGVDIETAFAEFDQLLYGRLAPILVELIGHIWLNPDYEKVRKSFKDSLLKQGGAKAVSRGLAAFNPLEEIIADLFIPHFALAKSEAQKVELMQILLHILENHPPNRRLIDNDCLRNPRLLYQHLKAFVPTEFEQSGATELRDLLQKLLLLTCELVIDLFEGLPIWNPDNLMSILGNQEVLLGHCQLIIDKWMASISTASESNIQQFEEEFRREVARRYDELNLFGIDISREARKYQLSVAYISLSMELSESGNQAALQDSYPVEEVLDRYPKLVALGGAGQGKTTLMQWLTVMCGRKTFPESMKEWNDRIPFLIKLRTILDRDMPVEGEFTAIMASELPTDNKPHKDWEIKILKEGRAVIMVDGFDEVPQERREKVIKWLDILSKKYPNNRYILTSRPSSYKQEFSLTDAGFEAVKLQPMTPDAMREFILHWHRAISLVLNPINPDYLADEAEKLLDELKQKKSLRQLVTNPLLCGVICALHHDRHGYLPNNRTEIYEATCQMLLERRDLERKVAEKDAALKSLSYTDKRVFLNDLAQWMMLNGQTVIQKSQIFKLFRDKIHYLPDLREKGLQEDALLDYFLERSGLLQQIGPNEVHFAHRTFQEYMAAKEFVDKDSMGFLKKNAGNDYWNETILLALGLCSNASSRLFISDLLKVARKLEDMGSTMPATRLYLLVIRGCDTMRQIPPEIQEIIEGKIKAFFPPDHREKRAALVESGDLALPFLAKEPNRTIKDDLYCALTLLQMKSEEAYSLLLDYLLDKRVGFIRSLSMLLRQLDYKILEDAGLIELILRKGPQKIPMEIIEALVFVSKDLRLYHKFPEKHLKITSKQMEIELTKDFDWYVPQNKGISFHFKIENNSILRSIKNLTIDKLSLSSLEEADTSAVIKMAGLKALEIDRINSIDILAQLINFSRSQGIPITLKTLYISKESADHVGLGLKLTRIARVKIGKISIEDLTPNTLKILGVLLKRVEASTLNISRVLIDGISGRGSVIDEIRMLVELMKMVNSSAIRLSINDFKICRVSKPRFDLNTKIDFILQNIANAQKIVINGGAAYDPIVIDRLSQIAKMKDLSLIDLSGVKIRNFCKLKGLSKLTKLVLSRTSVADLFALSIPSSLEYLNISGTKVSDLGPLKDLTNLKYLNVQRTPVNNLVQLSRLKNLENIDIRQTKVKSAAPLADLPNLKQVLANREVNTLALRRRYSYSESDWGTRLKMTDKLAHKKDRKPGAKKP